MWVADMNFATVPTVTEAIIERAKHPTYGYFMTSQEYYNKIIEWQGTQNPVNGLCTMLYPLFFNVLINPI